jgi:hypothetical protein
VIIHQFELSGALRTPENSNIPTRTNIVYKYRRYRIFFLHITKIVGIEKLRVYEFAMFPGKIEVRMVGAGHHAGSTGSRAQRAAGCDGGSPIDAVLPAYAPRSTRNDV